VHQLFAHLIETGAELLQPSEIDLCRRTTHNLFLLIEEQEQA
jgi:hypothetical protein